MSHKMCNFVKTFLDKIKQKRVKKICNFCIIYMLKLHILRGFWYIFRHQTIPTFLHDFIKNFLPFAFYLT